MLSLLTEDLLTLKKLEKDEKASENIFRFHENFAFDVIFEIEANIDGENIQSFCRVLTILTINPNNKLNVKQYKILVDRIIKRLRKNSCCSYFRPFCGMLQKVDMEN